MKIHKLSEHDYYITSLLYDRIRTNNIMINVRYVKKYMFWWNMKYDITIWIEYSNGISIHKSVTKIF